MEANFAVTNPDEIEIELTVKMTLRNWKKLKGCLKDSYPGWDFSRIITDMISQADKHFYPTQPKE